MHFFTAVDAVTVHPVARPARTLYHGLDRKGMRVTEAILAEDDPARVLFAESSALSNSPFLGRRYVYYNGVASTNYDGSISTERLTGGSRRLRLHRS